MSAAANVKLDPSWLDIIGPEFDKPYMTNLRSFLQSEKETGQIVYPKGTEICNAMNTTSFDDVRVVIIGQDPSHGEGQAHGLSFSVRKGVALPPSLLNIYKEIEAEYGIKMPREGDLTGWARQGVLLLNATLTVRRAIAGSHQNKGWEQFTDAIIHAINDRHENVVFMLWGSKPQLETMVFPTVSDAMKGILTSFSNVYSPSLSFPNIPIEALESKDTCPN